ncbi:MAG: hypothetical protein V4451_17000 [Pseudomonadota bacterium]
MNTRTEAMPPDLSQYFFYVKAESDGIMAESHVLLWSQSQCALHIESVGDMLKANRRAYTENRRMDYVPLFIGQREVCDSLASAVRNTMQLRQEARPEGVTI